MSEPLESEAGEDPGTLAIKRTRIGYAAALVGSRPSQVMSLPAEEPASTADMVPEIAAAAAGTAAGPHQAKKKEKEGGLTPAEQHRLEQIKKSEEFKTYTQAVVQHAKENGVKFDKNSDTKVIRAQTVDDHMEDRAITIQVDTADTNSSKVDVKNISEFESKNPSKLVAYAHFNNAPHLGEEFSAKVAMSKPSPIANDIDNGFDTTVPATVVAQAQIKPKSIDVSFS